MWKVAMGRDGGSNPVRIVNTPKFEANHVSNALFEITTVSLPRELTLSPILGRSEF
jgi:hypothetical protein